jgi:hypothetical protein
MLDLLVDRMMTEEIVRAAHRASQAGELDILTQLKETGSSTLTDTEASQLYHHYRAALPPGAAVGALQLRDFPAALIPLCPRWASNASLCTLLFARFTSPTTSLLEFPAYVELAALLQKGKNEEQLGLCLDLYSGYNDGTGETTSTPTPTNPQALRSATDAFLALHDVALFPDELDAVLSRVPSEATRITVVAAILDGLAPHGIGQVDVESDLGSFELMEK